MADHFVPEQLWLPRFEAASKPTDRLFFAILPDGVTAHRIAQLAHSLKNKYRLQGEPLLTKRFHVSLYHLGDYFHLPQDAVARATEAASAITLPPFEVAFDRVISFAGGHADPERQDSYPLVLLASEGVAELTALRQGLAAAMARTGTKPPGNMRFTPHLTLLYDGVHDISMPIEPIRWTVRELVLVHSLLGKTRYALTRLPLSGRLPVRSASSPAEATNTIAG